MDKCVKCNKKDDLEADHIIPVGTRPYTPEEFVEYIKKMFFGKCQPMCKKCNKLKGAKSEKDPS